MQPSSGRLSKGHDNAAGWRIHGRSPGSVVRSHVGSNRKRTYRSRGAPRPAPQPAYAQSLAPAYASQSGPTLALDEKQLKVTLMLEVVKLAAPK